MQEHFVHALVLAKSPLGEFNARVILYTAELGKVAARVQSVRKPASKLAGHTEPLMLIEARLVETRGFQLVDALSVGSLLKQPSDIHTVKQQLELVKLIEEISHEGHADPHLWELIESRKLTGKSVLTTLGFDPEHARCFYCNAVKPVHFILSETHYACDACYRRIARSSHRYELLRSRS